MRAILAIVLLAGFAAVNLLLNLYAPPSIKLLLVPITSLVLILVIASLFGRRRDRRSPPG